MKTFRTLILLCISSSLLLAQQNVPVGRMALRPADSAAIDTFLYSAENLNPQGGASVLSGALDASQTSLRLPADVASNCTWSYPVTSLSVSSNVATATVETFPAYLTGGSATSMPVGTRLTLSNSLQPLLNGVFTLAALQTQNQLTFSVVLPNGSYSNPSVDTNDFIILSYSRCSILIDSEVISIIGTADGSSFAAVRGELGTTAAPHALGAAVTLLRFPDKRHWYRSLITNATAEVFASGKATTTRYNVLLKALSDAQAALAQAGGRAAR